MALYGGAASRTPLLGPKFQSVQPFTRTITYPGGVNPNYRGSRTTTGGGGGGIGAPALAALRRAKAQYQPGGGFGKGVEAGLERGRVKAVSAGMQNLVSAGLAGTTMAGGLGLRYEEEVAAPTRAGLEEERARAVSGIEMQEAGMGFQAGQAGLQRGFQAGESAAGRSLQTYIANLQASLQRESMAFRSRPTAQPVRQAQQFPSLYDQGGAQPYPGLDDGGGVSGLARPGARQYDLPVDEKRFNIDFGPG